jgi:hypothetical protein
LHVIMQDSFAAWHTGCGLNSQRAIAPEWWNYL